MSKRVVQACIPPSEIARMQKPSVSRRIDMRNSWLRRGGILKRRFAKIRVTENLASVINKIHKRARARSIYCLQKERSLAARSNLSRSRSYFVRLVPIPNADRPQIAKQEHRFQHGGDYSAV